MKGRTGIWFPAVRPDQDRLDPPKQSWSTPRTLIGGANARHYPKTNGKPRQMRAHARAAQSTAAVLARAVSGLHVRRRRAGISRVRVRSLSLATRLNLAGSRKKPRKSGGCPPLQCEHRYFEGAFSAGPDLLPGRPGTLLSSEPAAPWLGIVLPVTPAPAPLLDLSAGPDLMPGTPGMPGFEVPPWPGAFCVSAAGNLPVVLGTLV